MPAISETVPSDADDVQETGGSIDTASNRSWIGFLGTVEYWCGLRFTTIGPSAGDTIDDANLRWGHQSDNMDAPDRVNIYVDIASSAQWGASDRPSQITKSTEFAAFPRETTPQSDVTQDITAVLQEWVDDGDYDGDVRFTMEAGNAMGAWDSMQITLTGTGSWGYQPVPTVLEGNYTAAAAAGGKIVSRVRQHYMALLHH